MSRFSFHFPLYRLGGSPLDDSFAADVRRAIREHSGRPLLDPRHMIQLPDNLAGRFVTAQHYPARPSPCPSCGVESLAPNHHLDVFGRCPACLRYVSYRRCHPDLWGNANWNALKAAVVAEWADWLPRGVAADYLEERGYYLYAFMLRNGEPGGSYPINGVSLSTVIQAQPSVLEAVRKRLEQDGKPAHNVGCEQLEPFLYDLPRLVGGNGYAARCGLIIGAECSVLSWFLNGRAIVAHPYSAIDPKHVRFRSSHPMNFEDNFTPAVRGYVGWCCMADPDEIVTEPRDVLTPGYMIPRPIFTSIAGGKLVWQEYDSPLDGRTRRREFLAFPTAVQANDALQAGAVEWANRSPSFDQPEWQPRAEAVRRITIRYVGGG